MGNRDRDDFAKLSLSCLERANSADEPEYSPDLVKEQATTLDFLEKEAQLGSHEAFEDYLANVPSTTPIRAEDVVM